MHSHDQNVADAQAHADESYLREAADILDVLAIGGTPSATGTWCHEVANALRRMAGDPTEETPNP